MDHFFQRQLVLDFTSALEVGVAVLKNAVLRTYQGFFCVCIYTASRNAVATQAE